ncbi:MAG: hypothetical protein HQL55_20260 [Magnetococcales bacterium]|nr:hypothetical protein [Magnetococcales bacterium]
MEVCLVVDEEGFACNPNDWTGLENTLKILSDLLEHVRIQRIMRRKSSLLWEAELWPETCLYNILFDNNCTVDKDILSALGQQLDRVQDWNTEGQAITSRQWAKARLNEKQATGCVVLSHHEDRQSDLHLVGTECGLLGFYRDAPRLGDMDAVALIQNGRLAYPNLHFKADIDKEVRKFSKSYNIIRSSLMQALADLDSFLPDLLRTYTREPEDLIRNFQAKSTFEISPESPSTHANKTAMNNREITHNGKNMSCQWHLKLERHRDRIHFCWETNARGENNIIIGIFTEHLPT